MTVPAMFKIEDGKIVDQVTFKDFLTFLNTKAFEHDKEAYKILCMDESGKEHPYETFTVDFGRKFIKVVGSRWKNPDSRYVYCFLDYEGNIYKSASWKAPAKHIRGTVFDKDYGWGTALNRYGATYLR